MRTIDGLLADASNALDEALSVAVGNENDELEALLEKAVKAVEAAAAFAETRENPREKGDDDGVEYGDPRDHRDGLE